MSTKKKNSVKWGKGTVSQADASRLNQIASTYQNLSENAKNLFIYSITSTFDFYPHKTTWSHNERNVLRLMWNKCNHDSITDTFRCSYQSMLGQAEVLGLYSQELDRRPLDETDGEWMLDMLNKGATPREVAIAYDIPYDYHETHMIPVNLDVQIKEEMKQNELFGENNDQG